MSETFDPNLIQLTDLFTDGFQNIKVAKVYDNGKMQAVVFPAVIYFGPPSDEQQVINYVSANVVICTQVSTTLEPLNTSIWIKATESNIYGHNIGHSTSTEASVKNTQSYSNIRVPIFFTVPTHSSGKYYWVAQLNGVTTPLTSPVTIDVVSYNVSVEPEDIEIVDIGMAGEMKLRVMRYKRTSENVPVGHKLMRYSGKNGMRFSNEEGSDYWCSNTWVPMMRHSGSTDAMGAFLDYKEDSICFIIHRCKFYGPSDYYADSKIAIFENGSYGYIIFAIAGGDEYYDGPEVEKAWDNGGIVMALSTNSTIKVSTDGDTYSVLSYEIYGDYIVEDNYGNEFDMDMDWNAGSDYYQTWKVTKFDHKN